MNTQLTAGSLFLEGLLSFFSPCVLPLIPLYFAYLTKGSSYTDEEGNTQYDRRKTFILTVGFVLGICTVFALAGLAASPLRQFFTDYRVLFEIIGGMILIFMALSVFGIIQIPLLAKFQPASVQAGSMSFFKAWLFGFTVSFAWSPCVGPMLAQAVLQASQAATASRGWMYLGCYTLGFIAIFLIAGLFTNEVLRFLKKYKGVVRFTGILSGLVVGGMGIYLLAQGTQDYTRMLKADSSVPSETAVDDIDPKETDQQADSQTATTDQYDFELPDIYGNTVSLKDFKGQTVVLDFYETWCTYCNEALGTLARADEMEDVKVLMIVTPKLGSEKTREGIRLFLENEGYAFHLVYDEDGTVTRQFGITGYPTTYFIKPDGEYYGYMPGYLPEDEFLAIVEECRTAGGE